MKRNILKLNIACALGLFSLLFFTGEAFAVINYENFAPAPFSNRMGVGNGIEIKNPKIPTDDFEHYNKQKWQTNIDWSIKDAK